VAGATASRHLSIMITAGILKKRKAGRWIYFRLNTEGSSLDPVSKWMKEPKSYFCVLGTHAEARWPKGGQEHLKMT